MNANLEYFYGDKRSLQDNSTKRPSVAIALALGILAFPLYSSAESPEKNGGDVQDMSDPLAVYTQVGAGVTDKGINIKIGQSYDTGNDKTVAMNVLEIKGGLGEYLGWSGSGQRDNSINSFRIRNFELDTTTGRGAQIDMNYLLDKSPLADEMGNISYSLLQGLPKMGRLNLYPLAGVGMAVGNNTLEDDGTIDSGYSVMGTFVTVGMYSKFTITDKIWINYNPIWNSTLSGSDIYKDNAYGDDEDSLVFHEASLSYQINPRLNVRLFANWNENVDVSNGDHRLEVNYQI
ncbi:MAG: hypothetical protein V7708_15985 [Oceanicoccus sp.]